jgi:uncharacterized surface protein with fasciclin (FAS1) repeats
MKTNFRFMAPVVLLLFVMSCTTAPRTESNAEENVPAGQSAVQDNDSQKNIVQTAVASSAHTTLVSALKAGNYVDALSNAGPFTVFAPTNDAFNKLPAGTLEDLIKPENKLKLQDILEYHVYVGVIRESMIQGTMNLNQVNGKNLTLSKDGDKLKVNGANVIATVPASNGIIYVTDEVLLPK